MKRIILILIALWILSLFVTYYFTYRYGTSQYYLICKWEESKNGKEWRGWYDMWFDDYVEVYYPDKTEKEKVR